MRDYNHPRKSSINVTAEFLRGHWRRVVAISALLLTPCSWQPHIEAGDLGSHVYNAWLAQLIQKGQAPGLYVARQWTNVLFDWLLLTIGNVFGLAAAEKLVVSLCVLVFLWGAFAFIGEISEQPPWTLVPALAILAYGYTFQMGFMNYYLSVGLACLGLALMWRARTWLDWWLAACFGVLAFVAHPIGFLFFVGVGAYRSTRWLQGLWKSLVPVSAGGALFGVHWYLAHQWAGEIDWGTPSFYLLNGADQVAVYGRRYVWLGCAVLIFVVACIVAEAFVRGRDLRWWKRFAPSAGLYGLAILAAALLPQNLRSGLYSGWIGLVVSRLTTITAILGLCLVGLVRPRRWHFVGFVILAAVYFSLLYQDQGWLNGLEANAEAILRKQPYGTRIIPTIVVPEGWRVPFIGHMVDRACIGHCFTYSNYEPPTKQFRVRVAASGSPIVTSSADDAEDMEGGNYEVEDSDPPLKLLYQCDPQDFSRLCLHDLVAGETTGKPRLRAPQSCSSSQ